MSLEMAFASLLSQYAPPAILINEHDQVVHMSEQACHFLDYGGGTPSLSIFSMLAPALQTVLRPAIRRARQTGNGAVTEIIKTDEAGGGIFIRLKVTPVQEHQLQSGALLIVVECLDAARSETPATGTALGGMCSDAIGQLYEKLEKSRIEMERLQREHDESLADLAASNEELHSINDELLLASKELEASKRELEVINNQLAATNADLECAATQAAKAHDDLHNFITAAEIATIFVSRCLRIKGYTPPAGALFNLGPADIRRPLLDLAVSAEYEGIAEDVAAVFDQLKKIEREIRFSNGKWYLLRLLPYRTEQDFIEGVVLTFIDVSSRKEAEEKLRLGEERWKLALEASGDGMWDWDLKSGKVVLSPTWKAILGYHELSFTIQPLKGWTKLVHPGDRAQVTAMVDIVAKGMAPVFSCEYRIRCRDGAWKWVLTRGAAVEWDDGEKPIRVVGTMSNISDKKMSEHQIWYRANFDDLTDLPNRSFFLDRLEQEVRHSQRSHLSFALLFIDLDRFKEVNDLHGHHAGDLLLKQVAERLRTCTRASDTVARLGGDEFTVILSATDDVANVELIAEEILEKLARPFDLSGQVVHISASIGITLYPRDASRTGDLIRNADQSMYVAKHAGRNQCRFFTQSMQDAALARITIINDLHRALPDQLRLYFQPIVDPSTGLIHKAEALLRWLHPDKGLILPGNFIHLAEETGFVNKIGDWVFAEAAVWAARWSRLLNEPFQISVNKSPLEFMSHHQKATLDWTSHLTDIGLDCRNISIEITEGVLLNANSAARDKLLSLRNAGIQVAIDDFGTGYSSMAYLKKYSVDYLKIDQSFIRDMVVDPASRAITEAIIIMAHKLGLKVIAEGVETPEQRDHLVAANCDYTQGFLHSQAVAPEEFEALLLNNPRHDEERRLRRYGKLTS